MQQKMILKISSAIKLSSNVPTIVRCLRTSAVLNVHPFYQAKFKRIEKFTIPNKDSAWDPKHIPMPLFDDYYNYPIHKCPLGIKHPGFWFRRRFVYVKEMEPELIVPDLTGFNLKPYVSYRTPDVYQDEFTAKALFNKTYGTQILTKYLQGKRMEFKVTNEDIKKARLKARQCCSDMFQPTAKELLKKDGCLEENV